MHIILSGWTKYNWPTELHASTATVLLLLLLLLLLCCVAVVLLLHYLLLVHDRACVNSPRLTSILLAGWLADCLPSCLVVCLHASILLFGCALNATWTSGSRQCISSSSTIIGQHSVAAAAKKRNTLHWANDTQHQISTTSCLVLKVRWIEKRSSSKKIHK